MKTLQNRINRIIMGGDENPSALRVILTTASFVYSQAMKIRDLLYAGQILPVRRLPAFVISVGNLTVGGTGKTPMTMYIARRFSRSGYKVSILSRGYKGLAEKKGAVVTDGVRLLLSSAEAGDEPYMMASSLTKIPIIVGANRFASGMRAIAQFGSDIIILDDGFQHRRLARNLNLTLIDAGRLFGNNRLLPAGPLREPVSALNRSDALILTRCGDPAVCRASEEFLHRIAPSAPVFKSYHVPVIRKIIKGNNSALYRRFQSSAGGDFSIKGERVFAFSALGDNAGFHRSVEQTGFHLCGCAEFPDHYRFSPDDFEIIFKSAARSGAAGLITTEKDFARIDAEPVFPVDLVVTGIDISFGDESYRFHKFLSDRL